VPAGLDLGRTTHEEIAVAILAELVQLRAAGALPRQAAGAGEAGVGRAAEAAHQTDPVCGMTVMADRSGNPLEYDGVTYYFCSAGCRRAFQDDPAAYVKRETRC
jgi:xanthine dehydrogenase accessory factor